MIKYDKITLLIFSIYTTSLSVIAMEQHNIDDKISLHDSYFVTFCHLGPKDLATSSLVCKEWLEIANSDILIWVPLCKRELGHYALHVKPDKLSCKQYYQKYYKSRSLAVDILNIANWSEDKINNTLIDENFLAYQNILIENLEMATFHYLQHFHIDTSAKIGSFLLAFSKISVLARNFVYGAVGHGNSVAGGKVRDTGIDAIVGAIVRPAWKFGKIIPDHERTNTKAYGYIYQDLEEALADIRPTPNASIRCGHLISEDTGCWDRAYIALDRVFWHSAHKAIEIALAPLKKNKNYIELPLWEKSKLVGLFIWAYIASAEFATRQYPRAYDTAHEKLKGEFKFSCADINKIISNGMWLLSDELVQNPYVSSFKRLLEGISDAHFQ